MRIKPADGVFGAAAVSSRKWAAAGRALEEADARKRAELALPKDEKGGPKGVEPTRYGDWERKGITYDF